MQTPVQVTFDGLPVSASIEDECLDEVTKLGRYCDTITTCRVTITASHRHQRKGMLYEIRVLVRVPGDELVVNRIPTRHRKAEDIHVVIRESFDQARRLLED